MATACTHTLMIIPMPPRTDNQSAINPRLPLRDQLKQTLTIVPRDRPEIREHVQEILAEHTKPTLPDKARRYAIAVIRWCAAGCPVRSKELQEACRLTCRACPSDQFDPKTETCKVCGCSVKKSRFAIRDKVAMATEICHQGHWPAR